MLRKILTLIVFCLLVNEFCSCRVFAQEEGVEITIYNQDLGLVKDKRFIEFKKGKNVIKWLDVASLIDPTSVKFKALKYENEVRIQEQNYEYDLVGTSKLLEKYIDKTIGVITKDNQAYDGSLLSFDEEQLILAKDKTKGPVVMVSRENVRDIKFPELPEGLITKPTLLWNIISDVSDKHLCELTYLTKGINWHADYVVVVDAKDVNLDLVGWVTIDNQSGTNYKNARLKLIAGDIHLLKPKKDVRVERYTLAMKGVTQDQEFKEEPLFEYHLYTLTRSTTLKDRQTKQINLLTNNNIPCQKTFTYNGARYGKKVEVSLEFVNSEKNGLGIPLPKGKIRVYKADKENALQFIGENEIDHTPKDEEIKLYLGDAFDVVGERKLVDRQKITQRIREDSYEIEIRNHKDEDIEVLVVEPQQGDWKVVNTTHDYKKKDANRLEFKIKVKKGAKEVIRYTVRCEW
ncbi:MAG: DUF4139 domain-containing protein [bacterium]|nr:DUF4139 domain-containing protein [bacterium]